MKWRSPKRRPSSWWWVIPALFPATPLAAATAPIQFDPPTHYCLGTNIDGICAGDFNGDTRIDLATFSANTTQRLTIWTNAGGGDFAVATNYLLTKAPRAIAAGYVNTDTNLDLVTVNFYGNSVSAFLGNGDGTFNRVDTSVPVNFSFASLALADFDEDGNTDVAVSAYGIRILRGAGDGTFTAFTNFSGAIAYYAVTAADLNNDGHADLVTGNFSLSSLSVYLGHGNGTFAAPANYNGAFADYRHAIQTADFNHDDHLDLVTANENNASVSIRLNNGDGTFGAETTYPTGDTAWSLQVADFNCDGDPDVVTGQNSAARNLAILPGNGDGTFGAALTNFAGVTAYFTSQAVAVGNFDGDGRPDIATVRGTNNAMSVRLNLSPEGPALTAAPVGAEVLLTWPDWAGYLLESSTNPPDAGNWVPVTNTPVLIGGQNLLTNPATEPFLFYRLRKPLR